MKCASCGLSTILIDRVLIIKKKRYLSDLDSRDCYHNEVIDPHGSAMEKCIGATREMEKIAGGSRKNGR